MGVWLVAASAFGVAAMVAWILAVQGTGQDGLEMALRATARTSTAFFLAAFLASPFRRLRHDAFSRWLVRDRRYLGLSFAASHAIHLALIVALGMTTPFEPDSLTLLVGGVAYVLIAAMAATSTDRAVSWLGRARWRRLHLVGLYYIWFVLFVTFLQGASQRPSSTFFATLLGAALLTRLVLLRQQQAVRDGAVG